MYRSFCAFYRGLCVPRALALAPLTAMQMQHRDRTALPDYIVDRLEAWSVPHGIGEHKHSGSLQAAQTDVPPVERAAIYWDTSATKPTPRCSLRAPGPRIKCIAGDLLRPRNSTGHWGSMKHQPGRDVRLAGPAACEVDFRHFGNDFPF